MKNLYDKTYRQSLIERYLDADTSIEEEKALANFYRNRKAQDLTEEELGIRNLMLGLENYTHPASSPKTSSIRISAILLAAAMIAGLIFLVFPIKEMFSSKSHLTGFAPTSQVVRSYPATTDESNENLNPAEEMERQDSLFLAATKDIVASSSKDNLKPHPSQANIHYTKNKKMLAVKEGKNREHQEGLEKNERKESMKDIERKEIQEEKGESFSNDFSHYYEVASLALPSAEQLKIDKQGDNVIISTTDDEGYTQYYTIDVSKAQDGLYQLHPLAQAN